jgi:hypothetical protein
MSVLGVDLAAGARKTYACALKYRDGGLSAELFAGCDDDRLLGLAEGRTKVAIDAPFGWPRAFVDALQAHRRFEAWPAPDEGPPETFRASLSFRETDRVVMQTRRPLSVSTDKLGVTAMRCAHLLHRWALAGESVDRTGAGRFVEVYPAGALVRWGLEGSRYKGSDKTALKSLVAAVSQAVPSLELSPADRQLCESTDDAFDALVAALVARAALLRLTDLPSPAVREQAAEEGWIHLPLRGSLPFVAQARSRLASTAAKALAARLAELGVAVGANGYTERLDDALLPTFAPHLKKAILADLAGKRGSELLKRGHEAPKFQASHSSACLAANVFGPWLDSRDPLPLRDESFAGQTHLEVECSSGLSGTPPTLDCLIEGPQILAVESKCTETFNAHTAHFKPAYRDVVARLADRTWRAEYERLAADPRRYRFLDAAQLIKHYLGLKRRFADRPITLAYLYWQPSNATEVAACVIHTAELAEFSRRLADPRVRFIGMSYTDLWEEWAGNTAPPWIRKHVGALRQRYDVAM